MERQQGPEKLASLILLDGQGGPIKDEILRSLLEERLPPEQRELNLEIFDGTEEGAEEILLRAATLPFLSPIRVIVVREADRLSSSDRERLVDHLKAHGSPHACFILITQKIDRRGSLFRFLQKAGKVISCSISGPQEVGDWLEGWATKEGKSLTPAAIQSLYEWAGDDPNLLMGELEKLMLMVGERTEIGIEDVLAQGGEKRHHIFEVMDALGYGKVEDALLGVRSLLECGEEPLRILGMISRHFRLLSKIKEMASEGISRAEMGRRLKIPSQYLHSLLSHAPFVSSEFLEEAFQDLLRTDLFLKSEKRLGSFALEKLIVNLGRKVAGSEGQDSLRGGLERTRGLT